MTNPAEFQKRSSAGFFLCIQGMGSNADVALISFFLDNSLVFYT